MRTGQSVVLRAVVGLHVDLLEAPGTRIPSFVEMVDRAIQRAVGAGQTPAAQYDAILIDEGLTGSPAGVVRWWCRWSIQDQQSAGALMTTRSRSR